MIDSLFNRAEHILETWWETGDDLSEKRTSGNFRHLKLMVAIKKLDFSTVNNSHLFNSA